MNLECEKGFESTNGDPCKTCAANFYGSGCVNSCECKHWESCDPVNGCVDISTTVNQDMHISYSTCSTCQQMRNNVEKSRDEFVRGRCRSDVKVVVSGAVGVLIGVGVSVIFIFFLKNIKRNKRIDPTIAETNASLEIQAETVNAYEEIDEIISISNDAYINQNGENSDTSSTSINTEQRSQNNLNTDYLNPYQPIIRTTEHHLYMTTVTSEDSSNTAQLDAAGDSPTFCNNDKTDGSGKSDSGSQMSRQLNYVELDMNATMSEDNKVSGKYENTRLFANQQTEKQTASQNTQYAEIVHTF
ncbi:unnamed protein product [Mytilus coruscus]|uniref:MEGF10_11 n=1 Tax=Mytilus coruscus TaxID=42192 RepID=A0A6J8EC60_MYTCO|nr:unnamed protein product [Mytilus coruscus]